MSARGRRPTQKPRVPARGFHPTQLRRLAEHLCKELTPAEAARLIEAVNGWARDWLFDVADNRQELQDESYRKASIRIARLAEELRSELAREPLFGGHLAVINGLPKLIQHAAAAATAKPPRPRGAPRQRWREELFVLVRELYLPHKAVIAELSHFEDTIEMLLEFLDVRLPDIHKEIRRVLAREPGLPFVVSGSALLER